MSSRTPRGSGTSPRRWAAAGALLAGLAMPPGPFASAQPGAGSIEPMTALAAADSADKLMTAHRYFEALPYIARVEHAAGTVDAGFMERAARAENNACYQVRFVDGLVVPVTRSSIERIELVGRSSWRLEQAEQQSEGAEQRSGIIASRARQLAVWGFPREGYAEYRRAHQVHALDVAARRDVRWLERVLRPVRAGAAAGGPR